MQVEATTPTPWLRHQVLVSKPLHLPFPISLVPCLHACTRSLGIAYPSLFL